MENLKLEPNGKFEPNSFAFCIKNGPSIVINEEGFKYNDVLVEDAGEVYELFKKFLGGQVEISDEDIDKESYIKFPILTYSVMEGHDDFNRVMRDSWVEGIKWYREQLKKKTK